MEFYFIVFCILAFFSFIEIMNLNKKVGANIFIVTSIFIFFLSFIRWETGTDWDAYIGYFNSITDWGQNGDFEIGFATINIFTKLLFDNYTVLLFILGAILFSFQSAAILKLSPYPITSLFFLWAVSFGNAMFVRQVIATVILFWSVTYIQEKRFWKFLLMIGFAMLFHRTSIVFIFAWWIFRLQWKMSTLLLLVAGSVLLSAVISIMLDSLGALLGGVIQSKLDVYLGGEEGETFGAKASLATIIIKGFANKLLVFTAALLMLKKASKSNVNFRGYINLYWFGIIIYFSTISLSVALIRFSFAYDIMQIILIAIILKNIKNVDWKIFVFVIFVFYLAFRHYVALTTNYYELFVPFKTIFH